MMTPSAAQSGDDSCGDANPGGGKLIMNLVMGNDGSSEAIAGDGSRNKARVAKQKSNTKFVEGVWLDRGELHFQIKGWQLDDTSFKAGLSPALRRAFLDCLNGQKEEKDSWYLNVDVSENSLTAEGMYSLVEFLRTLWDAAKIFVRTLRVYKNYLGDDGAFQVARLLVLQPFPVHELHLSHNQIGPLGAAEVLLAPASNPMDIYPFRIPPKNILFGGCWIRLEQNDIPEPAGLLKAVQSQNDITIVTTSHNSSQPFGPCRAPSWAKSAKGVPQAIVHAFTHQAASIKGTSSKGTAKGGSKGTSSSLALLKESAAIAEQAIHAVKSILTTDVLQIESKGEGRGRTRTRSSGSTDLEPELHLSRDETVKLENGATAKATAKAKAKAKVKAKAKAKEQWADFGPLGTNDGTRRQSDDMRVPTPPPPASTGLERAHAASSKSDGATLTVAELFEQQCRSGNGNAAYHQDGMFLQPEEEPSDQEKALQLIESLGLGEKDRAMMPQLKERIRIAENPVTEAYTIVTLFHTLARQGFCTLQNHWSSTAAWYYEDAYYFSPGITRDTLDAYVALQGMANGEVPSAAAEASASEIPSYPIDDTDANSVPQDIQLASLGDSTTVPDQMPETGVSVYEPEKTNDEATSVQDGEVVSLIGAPDIPATNADGLLDVPAPALDASEEGKADIDMISLLNKHLHLGDLSPTSPSFASLESTGTQPKAEDETLLKSCVGDESTAAAPVSAEQQEALHEPAYSKSSAAANLLKMMKTKHGGDDTPADGSVVDDV